MRCRRIPTHGRAVAQVWGSYVPILLQKSGVRSMFFRRLVDRDRRWFADPDALYATATLRDAHDPGGWWPATSDASRRRF